MACRIIYGEETDNQNLNNTNPDEKLIIKIEDVEDNCSQDHTQEKENWDITDTNSDTECSTIDSKQLESEILLGCQFTKTNEIPIEYEGNSQSVGNIGMCKPKGKRRNKSELEMFGTDINKDDDSQDDVFGDKNKMFRKYKLRKAEQRSVPARYAVDPAATPSPALSVTVPSTAVEQEMEILESGVGEYVPDVGRGRGRGRGRSRGCVSRSRGSRGAAGAGDQAPNELEEVRAIGAPDKRMVAAPTPTSKREHIQRKRAVEAARYLVPGARERKRPTRNPSPARAPPVFLPGIELPAEEAARPSGPLVAPSYRPATSEPRARPSREPQPGPSRVSPGGPLEPSAGPSWELPTGPGSAEPALEEVPAVIEIIDFGPPEADAGGMLPMLEVAADVETHSTPERQQQRTIGVHDPDMELVMNDYHQGLLDSDDDLNDDIDCDIDQPIVRSAVTELASTTDYTPAQLDILDREDRQNDAALRSLALESACDFSWENDEAIFQGQPETFTGTPGPTFDMTDQTSILDVFHKMVDVEFVDMLVDETNKYARQKIDKLKRKDQLTPRSRLRQWTPTDRPEMYSFLAVLILQGLYPLPEEENYFKFNGYGTMPYFRSIMTYDRFLLLKSLMHFTDNDTTDQTTSKTWKIDKVTDYFNKKFSSLYYPSKEIVVDESLLKWSGRLCESSTGYLWKLIVYTGKQTQGTDSQTDGIDRPTAGSPTLTTEDTTDRPTNDKVEAYADRVLTTGTDKIRPGNATALIVYKLVEPLLYRGHTLIMDNFYNSPLLARCLKQQKTDVYGTLRLNREFVPDSLRTLTKTDLRHGEVLASYCSDVSVMVWRDLTLVGMISTYHRFRIGATHKHGLTYKPSIVLEYNKSMGGVDRKDQFLSAQPIERSRNRVWYKKVFRRLYNAAIFNAFIIYGTRHPNVPHRRFRTLLAEDILRTYKQHDLTTMKMPMVHRPTARCPVEDDHFPEHTGSFKTRCFLCARGTVHKERRTAFRCRQCKVNLCIVGCFRDYHKN